MVVLRVPVVVGARARIRGRKREGMTGMGSRIAAVLASAAMLLAGGVVPGAYADEPTQAPAAAAATCTAGDWKTLKDCFANAPTDETAYVVNLTALIHVPAWTSDGEGVGTAAIVAKGASVTITAANGAGLTGLGMDGKTQTKRNPSVFYVNSTGSLTIESGTYEHLDVRDNGALAVSDGRLTVRGGTFRNNTTHSDGGVFYTNNSSETTIAGGSFSDNTAVGADGGGVLYQRAGSTKVTGGTFEDNIATGVGGGVIYQYSGSTVILGGTFQSNSTQSLNSVGGGAVFAIGTLTISGGTFTGNHTSTTRGFAGGGAIYAQGILTLKNNPVFTGNWAHPDTEIGKTPIVGGGKDGGAAAGAGGAIFLQTDSTGYLMGGTFENNESGYLGGAIYTEEGTLSYVGKTAATGNVAGHFGGGLWLCPSGNADSSKGGNIALWGNSVDNQLDSNNGQSNGMAGDDFAMMNPSNKNIAKTEFELMDTWFTSRVQKAVQWMVDGEPAKDASGYNRARFKVNRTQKQTADEKYNPGTITLKNTDNFGVALKAQVLKGIDTDAVYASAELKFKGNRAKWDGGAIGSNGRLSFSTPHTAAWGKIDAADPDPTKDSAFLSGSSWRLSTENGGAENSDLGEDANCKNGSTANTCWANREGDAENVKSIIVADNGDRDNNPADGRFSVDNLKAGKYTLTEEVAPGGFEKTDAAYTFTITENQKEVPTLSVDKAHTSTLVGGRYITNQRPAGLAWSKTDSKTGKRLEGSVWTITGPATDETITVEDCVADTKDRCANKTDKDNIAGGFHVEGLTAGDYALQETTAPAGHWLDKTVYTFTIQGIENETVKLKKDGNDMSDNTITNKPTEVSWLKVGADDESTPLTGSVWTLVRVKDGGGNVIAEDDLKNNTWDVDDCQPAGTDKAASCTGPDKDGAAGKFTLTGLAEGTYELTEKTAPDGYVKSDKTYTFTIGDTETTGENGKTIPVAISGAETGNRIVNTKALAALPLTGGRSALDWAVAGGVLAMLAVGVAVVRDRLRRRALGL